MRGDVGELADAWLILAQCYLGLGVKDAACKACLFAITLNANFREALLFMGDIVKGVNGLRWKSFADVADNSGVLFVRV